MALDRRCIEAIHMALIDEDGTPNIVHAGFAMTALPHKRIEATEWVRDGAATGSGLAGFTLRGGSRPGCSRSAMGDLEGKRREAGAAGWMP
jgi:hypothetical protein